MDKMKGVVKWFSPEKGFGFISTEKGEDIFVHYSTIRSDGFKTLQKGQSIEFDVIKGERGLQADNVEIIAQN